MRVDYDPRLVEEAVFLASRQDERLERDLHAATNPIVIISDDQEREEKLRQVHTSFFKRLKLDATLSSLLAERPLIACHVGRCYIRQAARGKDESAELFVKKSESATNPADRTLAIVVCAQSLLHTDSLASWMRRDLLHVSDMLDESFAYRPEVLEGLPARQNLMRDRYRVLWDLFVQARLTREGHAEESYTQRLFALLARAFHKYGPDFDTLFDRMSHETNLTNRQLLDWARHPATLFNAEPTVRRMPEQPNPGEECPLCGFPTYDWFPFQAGDLDPVAHAIRSARPHWNRQNGACRQCAEIYTAVETEHRKTTCSLPFPAVSLDSSLKQP